MPPGLSFKPAYAASQPCREVFGTRETEKPVSMRPMAHSATAAAVELAQPCGGEKPQGLADDLIKPTKAQMISVTAKSPKISR